MSERIPFNSLADSTEADRDIIEQALHRVLDSGWFILGKETAAFEEEFASYLGEGRAVGVASGTDAIEIALRALGIGEGDAVATVSLTAVGTIVGIQRSGAEPVFVDVDPKTLTMCPDSLRRTLAESRKKPVRCILPVHLYGQPADMDGICAIADQEGIHVVEDCAQATGARHRGRAAGTIGDAAAFSFYPTKNLAAIGDGGAVCTRSAQVAARAREVRQYGWKERYVSAIDGVNSRLDELQSAVLRVRLPLLHNRNLRRNALAKAYSASIDGNRILAPYVAPWTSEHVFHQYVVQTSERDLLQSFLRSEGIDTGVLYPVPIHLQEAYRGRYEADPAGLKETEMACSRLLCLPIFPELKDQAVGRITAALRQFCSERRCP